MNISDTTELTISDYKKMAANVNESYNGGLSLKRDQGFSVLSIEDKAYLVARLYGKYKERYEAYSISVLGKEFKKLSEEEQDQVRILSSSKWKNIENKLGGVRNIIALMGVDIVLLTNEALRLLKAKKMQLDKFGNEHLSDDGSVQIKALEFLSKLSGNYSEEIEATNKTSININFGSTVPNHPEDILSDNMEVVIGTARNLED